MGYYSVEINELELRIIYSFHDTGPGIVLDFRYRAVTPKEVSSSVGLIFWWGRNKPLGQMTACMTGSEKHCECVSEAFQARKQKTQRSAGCSGWSTVGRREGGGEETGEFVQNPAGALHVPGSLGYRLIENLGTRAMTSCHFR